MIRHWVPSLLNFQDSRVNDYYCRHALITPPGGRIEHTAKDRIHLLQGSRGLRLSAVVTTARAAFHDQLQARYPFAVAIPSLELPFRGSA
jgi:hypothetical protein